MRKYKSKVLIAEYNNNEKLENFSYTEVAYRLKDGSIIIEFDGQKCSIYGIKIGFNTYIARKGVYDISESDYCIWKRIRSKDNEGTFIDWELEIEFSDKQMDIDYDNTLRLVSEDIPF